MNFRCQNCQIEYNRQNKPKIIPCGHTFCEKCLEVDIIKSNLTCRICKAVHKGIILKNLITVNQLINQYSASEVKGEIKGNLTAINDQINYLYYILTKIDENNKTFEDDIINTKKAIEQSADELINQIKNQAKQLIFSLDENLSSKQDYINAVKTQISVFIEERQNIIKKFENVFEYNLITTDEEMHELSYYNYPSFSLKFEKYYLDASKGEKFMKKLKKLLGKIVVTPFDEIKTELCNNKAYTGYEEKEKNVPGFDYEAPSDAKISSSILANASLIDNIQEPLKPSKQLLKIIFIGESE